MEILAEGLENWQGMRKRLRLAKIGAGSVPVWQRSDRYSDRLGISADSKTGGIKNLTGPAQIA